jgi:hypothetical protein
MTLNNLKHTDPAYRYKKRLGMVRMRDQYESLTKAVYSEIAADHPRLADECQRQIRIRCERPVNRNGIRILD